MPRHCLALLLAATSMLVCRAATAQPYAGLATPGARGAGKPPPAELRNQPIATDTPGRWRDGLVFRGLGLRASATQIKGGDGTRWEGAGLLHERAYGLLTMDWITARYADRASFGYGSAGLEGEASLDLAIGARIPVGDEHGPVARLGIRGDLIRNEALFAGSLELPQLQLGYQWLGESIRADLVARAGWLALGRFEPDEAARDLDGAPQVGALLSLGFEIVQLDAGWSRIFADDGTADGPVDRLEAQVCVLFAPFVACADARWMRGDAVVTSEETSREVDAHSLYMGTSLTFSDIEHR